MKRYIIFAVAAITLLAGCQKDNTTIRFKANIEEWNSDGPKMIMGSGHQCWSSGDLLWANGQSGVAIQGSNSSSYYFEMNGNEGGYQVGYPRTNCQGYMTTSNPAVPTKSFLVNFPTEQDYHTIDGTRNELQLLDYSPMVGYAKDANAEYINFYNVGSLIAVNITNKSGADFLLGQINVFSPDDINGKYNVNMNDDGTISTTSREEGGAKKVILKFTKSLAQTISNNATKTFYIAMAPNNHAQLVVFAYRGEFTQDQIPGTPFIMENFNVIGLPETTGTTYGNPVATNLTDYQGYFNLQSGKIYNCNLTIE